MSLFFAMVFIFWAHGAKAWVSDWIQFELSNGHITIPVILNGKETRAMLDSGSSGNGISTRFVRENEGAFKYGRFINLRSVNETRRVRLIDDVEIGMFGQNFRMGELMPISTGRFDLLIGLPFFEKFIVQIDYPNSRLRLADRDAMNLKDVANVRMRRARGSSHPIIKVALNDEYEPWLTLDTGNSAGIYMRRIDALRFGWLEEFPTQDARSVGALGHVVDMEKFHLPTLRIGPYTLENVAITVPASGEKSNVGEQQAASLESRLTNNQSDGILGFDVLKHFVVTIDYKRRLLHLAPPSEPEA